VSGAQAVAGEWRGTQAWEDMDGDVGLKNLGGEVGIVGSGSKTNPNVRPLPRLCWILNLNGGVFLCI
jgi:hypothetical protein